MIRSLHCSCKQDDNFTSERIKRYSGVSSVHDRTVLRVLNKYGYHYGQARLKGLLTEKDLKLHMKFAKDIKKYYDNGRLEHAFISKLSTSCINQIQWIRQRLQKLWPGEKK